MLSAEEKEKIRNELQYGALNENELKSLSDLIKNMNDDALEYYEKTTQLKREQTENVLRRAYRGMGFIYMNKGNLIKGKIMFMKALQLNPQDNIASKELQLIRDFEKNTLNCPSCNNSIKLIDKKCNICNFDLIKTCHAVE